MAAVTLRFKAKVWLYDGQAAWHFVTLPKKLSQRLKRDFGYPRRGWGSLRVEAKLGPTAWKTSIFPDAKAGAYLLPLKAEIRRREGVCAGKSYAFTLTIEA